MDSVIDQVAQMERELLALTANQPPNPSQIKTFKVEGTTADALEIKTIVFDDVPRFYKAFTVSPGAILIYPDNIFELNIWGGPGVDYVVISLGSFTLV